MRYYLDTSALAKLLVAEDGTDVVFRVLESGGDLATGRIAYPEIRATLAAALRSSRIDEAAHAAARTTLDDLVWPELGVVEVTATLAQGAGDLAERHALRGFEAIHLAAALEVAGQDLVVVTWDRRLWDAARSEGIAVLPAERPGGAGRPTRTMRRRA